MTQHVCVAEEQESYPQVIYTVFQSSLFSSGETTCDRMFSFL